MGIAGSGKTTVARALAGRLSVPFADGDDFHDERRRSQMARGIALDDSDRMPWLLAIGGWLQQHRQSGAVVACSALRRRYRDVLRSHASGAVFLHLDGDAEVARSRASGRTGHFMPAALVSSQQATLEPLDDDETGLTVGFDRDVDEIVERAVSWAAFSH